MADVRVSKEGDHTAISQVLSACYRWLGEHSGLTEEQVAWLVQERASLALIEAEGVEHACLVACEGERLVGVVAYKDAQIARLYVEPSRHGHGIGRALYRAAEDAIRDAGFEAVELGSITGDSVPFYEVMGMSVTGHKEIREGVFAGHRVTLMRKQLRRDTAVEGEMGE